MAPLNALSFVVLPMHVFVDDGNRMPKKKAVICIVDDDESVREAMKSLMESLGLHAEVFGSAEEFLASNMTDGTACLIVDMQMPGLTGLSLHERLVASGNNVPTILITAYPDERTRA